MSSHTITVITRVFDSLLPTTSLAIARIFGGIPQSFFETYHEHLSKSEPEDEYELRGDLYELYHYLNHTVLFGVRGLFFIRWGMLSK